MNYGFLIRNDRCIGCHACSTACKSENDVPVGVNRTWVKTVEKGVFPDVRRHFQVTRCNHCANPPCVRICPVTAMYKRAAGIVEFDADRCIGCKACLQACPYDAIYIDPDSGTAAKCHFCAHRVDIGLEPACVVVCPTHAIVAGDMSDPDSEISAMLATLAVTVRKPEQGTAPQLFYVDGDEAALDPSAVDPATEGFAWAESMPGQGGEVKAASGRPNGSVGRGTNGSGGFGRSASGESIRPPAAQGAGGPLHVESGRMAAQMVRPFYDAQHRMPWHWPVPAYLVTKGIGAGLFMLIALGTLLDLVPFNTGEALVLGFLSLLFIGVTTALLVFDLERPERFLTILTRPQWASWLTRGSYILVGFSLLASGWWVLELGASSGWWNPVLAVMLRPWALGLGGVLAAGVAVYTGFLFGQAEGRDLWQSPLLPVHLLLQAFLAGAATVLWVGPFLDLGPELMSFATVTFLITLTGDLVMLVGELGMPHASADAARAAREIVRGRFGRIFWLGVVLGGHALPLLLLLGDSGAAASLAGMLALAGLYLFEHAFVMAPQEIPNS